MHVIRVLPNIDSFERETSQYGHNAIGFQYRDIQNDAMYCAITISDINISQGNVVMHLRCTRMFICYQDCKFTAESVGEIILNIRSTFAKVVSKSMVAPLFIRSSPLVLLRW